MQNDYRGGVNRVNLDSHIEKNYENLMLSCIKYLKSKSVDFDEDVFQETLFNIITMIDTEKKTFENTKCLDAYIVTSVYTNTLRDKSYHRNKNRVSLDDVSMHNMSFDHGHNDLGHIMEDIRYNFRDTADMFFDHIDGEKVSSLKKMYPNVKNAYGKINKIKSYIRKKYNNDLGLSY